MTMKLRKIDNFAKWRKKMIKARKIISQHPPLQHSVKLAVLIGIILGDGHIYRHPRVDKLTITLGTNKPKLIRFTQKLMLKVFNKKPTIYKQKNSNCVRLYIYQKHLSNRLKIPVGNRKFSKNLIPFWISKIKK